MKLKIDLNAKLADIQHYFRIYPEIIEQSRNHIKENLDSSIFSFYGMTISEFLQLQENKMPKKIEALLANKNTTLKTYIKILNTFESGAKSFEAIIERTSIEQSIEERIASTNLLSMTAEETMLSFVKEYFNLNNFEQAQNITIYEYIIAKKIHYNNVMFQKNMTEQQKNKI